MFPLSTANQEWILLKTVAEDMGVATTTIRHAFDRHPEIKALHYKIVRRKTGHGCDAYVTKEGIALLTFRKAHADTGNQFKKILPIYDGAPASSQNLTKAQDSMALAMAEYMKDPVIAMRMEQMQMKDDIQELKLFKNHFQPLLEDVHPTTLTDSQRRHLNERVRALGIRAGMLIPHVWHKVHEQVGCFSLDDYKPEDYNVAIKHLKRLYAHYNVTW